MTMSPNRGNPLSNVAVSVIYARPKSVNADGSAGLPSWIDSTSSLGLPISTVCELNNFVHDLIDSAFMDLLANTYVAAGEPRIGRGTFSGSTIVDLPFNHVDGSPAIQIVHTDLENMLVTSVQMGLIAQPGANSLYLVFVFGSELQVVEPGSGGVLGSDNYGFHHSMVFPNGKTAAYCVVDASQPDEALTMATSHELAEAITDPWADGWYDENGNEVCDLCPPGGTYTLEQLELQGSMFHGHLISKFMSPTQNACIAPLDDNNIKSGPVLKINVSRASADTCVFGFLEGITYKFGVSGVLDGKPVPVQDATWNVIGAQSTAGPSSVRVTAPPAGTGFSVSVSAYNDWGCPLSATGQYLSISGATARLQELLCQIRHEILWYWRYIDPLWDPLRDFAVRPVTGDELRAADRLFERLVTWHAEFNRLSAGETQELRGIIERHRKEVAVKWGFVRRS